MADIKLQSEIQETPGSFLTWDFFVDPVTNIAPFVEGALADSQEAALFTYIDKDSIPQLPGIGVPWTQTLTGQATFAEVDTTIRYNLNTAGLPFEPKYDTIEGNLTCTVVKK